VEIFDNDDYRAPRPVMLPRDGPLVNPGFYDSDLVHYSYELDNTEYGKMLRLSFHNLDEVDALAPPGEIVTRYMGEVCFGESGGIGITQRDLGLGPSYDGESRVPIMVSSHDEVEISLTIIYEYRRSFQPLIFSESRKRISTYTETVIYNGSATNEWLMIPIETKERG
jgi:hypothetical protein